MRLYASLAAAMLLAPNLLLAQTISPTPTEGDNTVSIQNTSGKDLPIKLKIFTPPLPKLVPIPPASEPPTRMCDTTNTTDIALKAGTNAMTIEGNLTTVTLDKPLVGRSTICAIVNDKPGPAIEVLPPATPPGFDWGLVRAYFTVGDLASQERDQFSHQDLFLAFRLDKTYVTMQRFDEHGEPTMKHGFGLSSFFETRLTALPVAVQSCTPTADTTCSNSNSSSTTTPTGTIPSTDAFLNSQKTARLLFGIYTPVRLKYWSVPTKTASGTVEAPYALYIAPLIKTGFDTTLNGLNQTQQQSTTPTTVQSIGNTNQFYKFYDFGFRLGHYALSKSAGTAPDQLSYLDVSWGRFSNLASLLCPTAQYLGNNMCGPATVGGPAPNLAWHRDVRMNVEGLLEVPATHGFSIGFSTNVSYYPGSKKNSDLVHIRPADDLRFLFAYKFDISKVAAKLAPGFGN